MPATLQSELRKRRPFDSLEQEAYLNILRTASLLAIDFDRLFRERGLSEATYNVLRILRGHAPASVPCSTIGEEMVTHVPDVTRLVDRLVVADLAERARTEEDRRVVLVSITRQGLRLLAELDQPILELHARQLRHVPRAQLRELSRLLVWARGTDAPE